MTGFSSLSNIVPALCWAGKEREELDLESRRVKTATIRVDRRRDDGEPSKSERDSQSSVRILLAARALFGARFFSTGVSSLYLLPENKTSPSHKHTGKSQGHTAASGKELGCVAYRARTRKWCPPSTRRKQQRHLGRTLKRGMFLPERLRQ